jgi:hypothetical protein
VWGEDWGYSPTPSRTQRGGQPKGDTVWCAHSDITSEHFFIDARKLALEQPMEFSIPGRFLAIQHSEGVWRIPRLLDKDLRERYHLRIVLKRFSQIDHVVSGIYRTTYVNQS